jgi:hypothetical protein
MKGENKMNEPLMKGADGTLTAIIYADNEQLEDRCNPDADAPDPFAKILEQAAIDHALARVPGSRNVSLDWLAVGESEDIFELDARPTIAKAEPGSRNTLAKKLGITRTEEKIIEGVRWQDAFNATGELVHTRVLLPE